MRTNPFAQEITSIHQHYEIPPRAESESQDESKRKHACCYQRFDKWLECCRVCGRMNPVIKEYIELTQIAVDLGLKTPKHPYIRDGRWTITDLKRYMKGRSK